MSDSRIILIVDDDDGSRETLEAMLHGCGHTFERAACGTEALELFVERPPDLVLLDVMMPGMDGYEVCRRMRAVPLLGDVPILMTTVLDDRASRVKGIEAGADDFISKPIDSLELRTRVTTILRLNRFRRLQSQHTQLLKAHVVLEQSYESTLEGWVRALDLRDHETDQHSQRVAAMSIALGRALRLSQEDLVQIGRSALLHDIGKIGIPDGILLKTSPLTSEEWRIMQTHPRLGYDMLAQIEFLRPALEIPLCHHERWDGTGYPGGLKGLEIPLFARIFAPVDVWDALASDRPYRQAWERDRIIAHIRAGSGSHFDPSIVEPFLALAPMPPSKRG